MIHTYLFVIISHRDAVEGGGQGGHMPPLPSARGGKGGSVKQRKNALFAVKMCPYSDLAPPALKSQRRP